MLISIHIIYTIVKFKAEQKIKMYKIKSIQHFLDINTVQGYCFD